jgi:putative spermidine/putrescine transport system ATP-binding protein
MSDRIAVMDGGRIIQIGAPNEVYDEPETGFVAGFVGVSNLLELRVEKVEGDTATLKLGDQDSVTTTAGHLSPGQTAIVTIRPERISVVDRGPSTVDGRCHASGIVRESLYAGPMTRFVVELHGGGELMVVRQNAYTSFEDAETLRGQTVTLEWGREYTRVIGTKEEDS